MAKLSIRELNRELLLHAEKHESFTYQFADGYITQQGLDVYSRYDLSVLLARQFYPSKDPKNSYLYHLKSLPTLQEIESHVRSLPQLISNVINC